MESLIPLYISPTSSGSTCTSPAWQSAAFGGSRVTAIINPNSGPIPSSDPMFSVYLACCTMLHTAGVKMVGYVPTKQTTYEGGVWTQTGFRSPTAVRSMVNGYADTLIGPLLNGIFVDEVSSAWQASSKTEWGNHTAYYRSLFSEIRHLNYSIVANSGGWPPKGLLDARTGGADMAVIFEGSLSRWDPTIVGSSCLDKLWTQSQGSFPPGPWCPYVPNWDGVDAFISSAAGGTIGSKLAALVYDTSESNVRSIRTQAIAAGVNTVYATSSSLWGTIPSWWCEVLDEPEGTLCMASPPSLSSPPSPSSSPSSPLSQHLAGDNARFVIEADALVQVQDGAVLTIGVPE